MSCPISSMGSGGQSIITWALLNLPLSDSSRDELIMQYQLGALATCTAIFVYVFLRKYRKPSAIRDVPGPANPSWIFGTSPAFASSVPVALNVNTPQDISGISCPKKLVGQRRGSSRILGTSFVGTAPLGYVSSFIKQTPVYTFDPNDWCVRVGRSLVDRGPQGYKPHPPEVRLSVCEAKGESGSVGVVQRFWYRIGRGYVVCHDPFFSLGCLTTPQVMYTSVRGGRLLQPSVSSRPRVYYPISWMLLLKYVNSARI